jgi:hypothetical protein
MKFGVIRGAYTALSGRRHYIERIAHHQNRDPDAVWAESHLTRAELAQNPLAL